MKNMTWKSGGSSALALLLAFSPLCACSVDFDGYAFDDEKFAEASGDGDGDGDGDDPSASEECIEFCDDQEEICGFEDEGRYASKEECLTLCSGYFENEFSCRITHLDFATEDPETHCPHTIEDGGNTCPDARSSSCDRFCLRAELACPFDEGGDGVFTSGSACDEACAAFGDNGLECRFVELGKAEEGDTSACPSLLPDGGSECSED